MRIKSVMVTTPLGEIYTVGHTVNDVVIDDIIQNKETQDIFCYDSNSRLLVKITNGTPTVIEYIEGEKDCLLVGRKTYY